MALIPETRGESRRADIPEQASEELELVRASQSGNTRAFEDIVRLHSSRVYNYLFHMTRQRQDAEDLAQQTFVKAYRNIHRFDPARPIINWLLTIARRTALNHFRSAKHWSEIPDDAASDGVSPARQAEKRDQIDNLWGRARRILGQREYNVLWLRFGEDLSIEETARISGLTKIHVKVLVFRAQQQLMKTEKHL
jgi:RNA polymerase sigma-70 factor (ECF subfamily)